MTTSFALLASLLIFPAEPSLTRVTEAAPAAWSRAIRDVLEAEAWTVTTESCTMTFRFRKELTGKATAEQVKNGITARELTEGQLVAVVAFEKQFIDYRKQTIAAGTYTLRLGFQPDIGDHKGTAPYTEFLLLTPLAEDDKPDDVDADAMRKRSAKAADGDHPAVMLLAPRSGDGEPTLEAKKAGARVMTVVRRVATSTPTTIRLGIVVEGFSTTR